MAQPQHWQPEPPPRADAQLNYLAYDGERPVTYARSLPSGSRVEGPPAELHAVRIQNARRLASAPLLDRNGLQLLAPFGSSTDGAARMTAHTAFDDPSAPPDALPRRSNELRTLVFWD